MKKSILLLIVLAVALAFAGCEKDLVEEPDSSTELKSGNSGNNKITGVDEYGYNWNAHLFKGSFYNAIVGDNLYASAPWSHTTPYRGIDEDITPPEYSEEPEDMYDLWGMAWWLRHVNLVMKWNESLISKEGVYPANLDDWIGSDGWITFEFSGIDANGKNWSQFQKMVAANHDDMLKKDGEWYPNGVWYNSDDEEIGIFNDWTQLILVQCEKTGEPPFPFSTIPEYNNTERLGFGITKK
ncbi:hypothetical protein [Draconibacterium halophilum]|uniref:Uncharacterized protein n=1 Tax=Draconibacterium halophilum TaxID=2706887 RepID=A0A6C0RIK8_9BACT|nr:hypothetical protein [Draconibacterium halophilum]QIA09383.1 hypothetical protein G0Q07_17460 [Draconibacterium halophilum]